MSAHVLSEEDTEKRKKTTIVDLWKFTELFIGGRVFVFRVITHSSVCMLITQGGGWDVGVDGALEMNWSTPSLSSAWVCDHKEALEKDLWAYVFLVLQRFPITVSMYN